MTKVFKNRALALGAGLAIAFFIWLGVYGYRSIEHSEGVWWAIALWIYLAIGQSVKAHFDDVQSGGRFDPILLVLNFSLFLLISIPFTLLIIGALIGIKEVFLFIFQISSTSTSNTLSLFLALILGYGLFKIREHFKFFYGLSEVTMGTMIAYYKYPFDTSLDYSLAAIAGSVYLIVRGFDNMQQGRLNDKLFIRLPFRKENYE